jgi:bifunctional non-homologous end joining protein LigD
MSSRIRNLRGRPINGPPGFINPCRPILAKRLPRGKGWLHEVKHDGYRLQIHVRDGRVRLFTMNGNNWTDRYRALLKKQGASRARPYWMQKSSI